MSVPLNPVVWLFATLSLMLLNAADWAVRPLTAVSNAPNREDMDAFSDRGAHPGTRWRRHRRNRARATWRDSVPNRAVGRP